MKPIAKHPQFKSCNKFGRYKILNFKTTVMLSLILTSLTAMAEIARERKREVIDDGVPPPTHAPRPITHPTLPLNNAIESEKDTQQKEGEGISSSFKGEFEPRTETPAKIETDGGIKSKLEEVINPVTAQAAQSEMTDKTGEEFKKLTEGCFRRYKNEGQRRGAIPMPTLPSPISQNDAGIAIKNPVKGRGGKGKIGADTNAFIADFMQKEASQTLEDCLLRAVEKVTLITRKENVKCGCAVKGLPQ